MKKRSVCVRAFEICIFYERPRQPRINILYFQAYKIEYILFLATMGSIPEIVKVISTDHPSCNCYYIGLLSILPEHFSELNSQEPESTFFDGSSKIG